MKRRISLRRPTVWIGVVLLSGAALISPYGPVGAHQADRDSILRVACDGLACGGSGGASASPFLYRIRTGGKPVTYFEVGVEDGDLAHYASFVHPPNWEVSLHAGERFHDGLPSAHADVTGSAGTCSFVLRFSMGASGAKQTGNFDLGYAYTLGKPGVHDVHWASDGSQASWTHPLGIGKGSVHSPVRLNVLVIVLDDTGTDKLKIYDELYEELDAVPGSPSAGTRTPRLDALAQAGIRFTNYYTHPLCSASRASLLTGRYPFRTGQGSVQEPSTGSCDDPVPEPGELCFELLDQEVFLPELLKAGFAPGATYASGAFGKYHLSYWTPDADLPPVRGLESHAVENGFDRFVGTMQNVATDPQYDHFTWKRVEHDAHGGDPVVSVVADRWNAGVVREDAVAWINAQSAPFFAYVAFNPPHLPAQIPPLELLSAQTRDALTACGDPCTDPYLVQRAMLEGVDTEMGKLLDGIDAVRRANTMVFVVSDNGTPKEFIEPPHNDSRGKATVYQSGVRVPMVVSGPLVPAAGPGGWRADHLVSVVDFWRTIGEITGASESLAFQGLGLVPCGETWIDSISFLPLIEAPGQPTPGPRTWAFCQQFLPNITPVSLCDPLSEVPFLYDCLGSHRRAITDGEFKLMRRRTSPACAQPSVSDERFFWIGPLGRPGADVGESADLLDASGNLRPSAPPHAAAALGALRDRMTSLSGP